MKGTLALVSLPIGNKLDITLNATETLKNADIIATEDTRIFKVFSNSIGIKYNRLTSYYKDNENKKAQYLLNALREGKSVALVSDAGTPVLSDPGFRIVDLCYRENIPIKVCPGASSITCALAVCPFLVENFYFVGFVPNQEIKRDKLFESIKTMPSLIVAFEAPHRILKHLKSAKKYFNDRKVFVARELTKRYEEKIVGTISEVISYFEKKSIKGEFVLIYSKPNNMIDVTQIKEIALKDKRSTKVLAKELRKKSNLSSSEIYKIVESQRSSLSQ